MFPGRLVSYHLKNRLQKASGVPPPIQHWNINWKRSVLQGYVFPDHFRLHCYKPRTTDARWIIVLRPIGSFDCALRLCELPATKLVLWKKRNNNFRKKKGHWGYKYSLSVMHKLKSKQEISRINYFLYTENKNADRVNNNTFHFCICLISPSTCGFPPLK